MGTHMVYHDYQRSGDLVGNNKGQVGHIPTLLYNQPTARNLSGRAVHDDFRFNVEAGGPAKWHIRLPKRRHVSTSTENVVKHASANRTFIFLPSCALNSKRRASSYRCVRMRL